MLKRILTFVLLLLAACAPTSRSPDVGTAEALTEIRLQKQLAAQEWMKQLERLYRVGSPIMAANAPLCGRKIWPYHGMMLESLANVPEIEKDAMRIFYGIENQLTVGYVVEGSPGSGKVMRGDRILKVDGRKVPSGSKGFETFYETILADGRDVTAPISLTVERGRKNKREEVVIHPVPACASFLRYSRDTSINAKADRINITVYQGMMYFLANDDDALALTIAHELSHNVRNHIETGLINEWLGQMTGLIVGAATGMDFSDLFGKWGAEAYSQEIETEADYVGLYMVARTGGYDLDKAIAAERRMAAISPASIHLSGTTHPSAAKRFLSLTKTAAEIREKQKRGLPLIPNEKTAMQILGDVGDVR